LDDDEETPSSGNTLTKTRTEAFSDGVLAIAITLLVLDLALKPPGSPLEQFFHAWPAYLGYLVSFLTIGAAWIAHNALTDGLDRVDRIFLRLNLLYLLLVAFLPFPTRLVADALHQSTGAEQVATVVYGITLLAIRLSFFALSAYAQRTHLRRPGADDADMEEARKKFRYAVIGYVITILLSLVAPTAAVVIYLAIAVFLVVPFRAVVHELRGRRAH
jgi:uncharacterized membrane protein